jgi:hypothetical protein
MLHIESSPEQQCQGGLQSGGSDPDVLNARLEGGDFHAPLASSSF